MNPPQLLPPPSLAHTVGQVPVWAWLCIGGAAVIYMLYRFVMLALGKLATAGTVVLLGVAAYGVLRLHNAVVTWQKHVLHPQARANTLHRAAASSGSSGIINPLTSGMPDSTLQGFNLNAMNPLAHENAWIVAVVVVAVVLGGLGYLICRGMSPMTRAKFLQRMRSYSTYTPRTFAPRRTDHPNKFPLVGIEIGVRKDNGRPITIDGTDRFINTLVLGSIGTGKTSRILTKGVYQDIRSMADGVPMDVIVLDPDGAFAEKAVQMAKRFGIHTDIMDLRGNMQSTVSFNPFTGGDIADIIDNVRAALQEKMGKQDGFFQNAQDDLVRTVIQVQVPLWPETDFLQFADLVTDPLHFRAICSMVNDHATWRLSSTPPKKKRKPDEMDDITGMWEHERPEIEARFDAMSPAVKSMVLSAARSFLMDTRSEQKMEKLETITKGLKIVVNELATNPRLRETFSTESLPPLDFKSFLATGKGEKGRLMAVVTGNRPAGKLFGKLFLVTLKMYTLERGGTEDTRRPVYLYVDEFAVYGTESFTEMFSQARKYRVGMMLAIQARAQLLDVSKKFMDVVEGSCRNKVYFPAPSPDDARFLEHALGTVTNVKETYSENKLNWFWFDNRNLDRRVSTHETIDPRYRLEDIAYNLSKDEAIFAMTVDNQVQVPCVGITSFADEWVNQRRGFFRVQAANTGHGKKRWFKGTHDTPKTDTPEARSELAVESNSGAPDADEQMAVSTSTTNQTPQTDAQVAATNEPMETKYVRQTANPDTVIAVDELLRVQASKEPSTGSIPPSSMGQLSQTDATGETGPIGESAVATAKVTRIDLRKRANSASATEKPCPSCESGRLELTEDGRKWRCPECGFERKKR